MPTFVAVTDVLTEKVRIEWTINDWRLVMRFSDLEDNETFGPCIKLKQIPKSELRVSIVGVTRNRAGECLMPQLCLVGSDIHTNSALVRGTVGLFGPQNHEHGTNKLDRRVNVGEIIAGPPVLKSKISTDMVTVISDIKITVKKSDYRYTSMHPPNSSEYHNQPEGDLVDRYEAVNQQVHPDLVVRVGDATFKAHKTVFMARSEVFKSLLEQAKGKRKNTLEITNTTPEIWERFQDYMYTGHLPFNKDHLDDSVAMLMLSERYQVHSLTDELVEKLQGAITKYNVLDVYDIAEHFHLNDLQTRTVDYIRQNADYFKSDKAENQRKRIWSNPKLAEQMFNQL